jgi:hypothetical protein
MIISAKETFDNLDSKGIKQNILTAGIRELELWKRAIAADEKLFNQLYEFIFSDEQKLAWRSCWILDTASEASPNLFADKLPELIDGLSATKNSSLKRHFTRILSRYQIPEEYLGKVVNLSFDLLKPSEPPAVRVNALQILYNIALQLPDLKGELIAVVDQLIAEGGSAGFMNRSARILKILRS